MQPLRQVRPLNSCWAEGEDRAVDDWRPVHTYDVGLTVTGLAQAQLWYSSLAHAQFWCSRLEAGPHTYDVRLVTGLFHAQLHGPSNAFYLSTA